MTGARVVVVTGGAGRLGQRLVPELRRGGWWTRALVHDRQVPGVDEAVDDRVPLAEAVGDADAILHLAGVTHARAAGGYERANVAPTRALVEAVAAAGGRARFVFVSSRAASPAGGAYARSKLAAEELVRASGVPYVVLRLAEVFGTGSGTGVDAVIAAVERGARVLVIGRGADIVCPVHVDDVVPAIVRALAADEAVGSIFTLGGECMTVRELARRVARAHGAEPRVVGVPRTAVAVAAAAARFLPLPIYPDQLARLEAPKPLPDATAPIVLGFAPAPLEERLQQRPE
jgi:NADH dehydrogenase